MKINSVRLGHATNSSSSHSIVITNQAYRDSDIWDGEFGWDEFICASPEAKMTYFAVTLYQNLRDILDDEMARTVAEAWIAPVPEESYIDHQSVYTLPKKRKGFNRVFIEDFQKFLLREDVVIQGGNDNSDLSHVLNGKYLTLPIPQESNPSHYSARKDGEHWVLYNDISGAKIRFSFNQDAPEYTKASIPELIDLKITDYCTSKCPYCYQSSSKEGKHAERDVINRIIYALADMEVFEVAFGGGDPLSHPHFVEFLRNCRYYGITPNFTTRRLDWLSWEYAKEIIDLCGSFGLSAEYARDVKKLYSLVTSYPLEADIAHKVSIHVIPGVVGEGYLREILALCASLGFTVLLLGYKSVGRGRDYKPQACNWLKIVQDLKKAHLYPRIAIDTELARMWRDELEEAGYSRLLYATEEGKFSCYIDAVSGMIAPSSYAAEQYPLDLTPRGCAESIKERFTKF